MNPQKQELIEKIKGANNILVTVSANPSVDQLAACIGMTLLLNKLKKHATAVFSGDVPSTIEFLKPEDTLEKTTDSLRDFIISLDKSKADKLRYKVEDQVVRIFITPYRTSITQDDLEFSQGDFNVDVVLCLGVSQQQDLDQAITMHGRILHDAVVTSINTQAGGELGTVNWTEPGASSLSELVAGLSDALGKDLLDAQTATALLTGIVAETARFSNEKTSPETMRLSAALMTAGANQQLVANELDAPPQPIPAAETDNESKGDDDLSGQGPAAPPNDDGTIEITHSQADTAEHFELPEPLENPEFPGVEDPATAFQDPQPSASPPPEEPSEPSPPPASRMVLQPPSMGGMLTANTVPEDDILRDPLSVRPSTEQRQPMLDHNVSSAHSEPVEPAPSEPAPSAVDDLLPSELLPPEPSVTSTPDPLPEPVTPSVPAADEPPKTEDVVIPPPPPDQPEPPVDTKQETLTQLEAAVQSPHVSESPVSAETVPEPGATVDAARDAVMDALSGAAPSGPLPPTKASGSMGYLNVQDLPGINEDTAKSAPPDLTEAAASQPSPLTPVDPLPSQPVPGPSNTVTKPESDAPPPVPPPLPLTDMSKFMPT